MESKTERPCFVYVAQVIQRGYSACKIGRSVDPAKRLRELNTGRERKARLIGQVEFPSVEAAHDAEQWMHYGLSRVRMRGEWFNCRPVTALSCLMARAAGSTKADQLLSMAAEADQIQGLANRLHEHAAGLSNFQSARRREEFALARRVERRSRKIATRIVRKFRPAGNWGEMSLWRAPRDRPMRSLVV